MSALCASTSRLCVRQRSVMNPSYVFRGLGASLSANNVSQITAVDVDPNPMTALDVVPPKLDGDLPVRI